MKSRLLAGISSCPWTRKVGVFSAAGFCTAADNAVCPPDLVPDHPILVREFIQRVLYHPQHGYFAAKPQVVGMLSEPLNFNIMRGRRDYMEKLSALYKQNDVSWFTPAELFKPWYGYGIANFILKNHLLDFPLRIYEIGGGTGTCARDILDHIKLKSPAIYKSMSYRSIEISSALATHQMEYVHTVKSHKSHFSVECHNACDGFGWGKLDMQPCFVLMLEVLDNQPHDLVCKESINGPWFETYVTTEYKRSSGGRIVETYQALQDPLIHRCIEVMHRRPRPTISLLSTIKEVFLSVMPGSKKAWVPTGSMQLLETLYAAHPNAVIIASDFSMLPDVKVEGKGAPLVSRKKDGVTIDLTTYLDVRGDADIFFPTDFQLLKDLDQHCYQAALSSNSSKEHSRRRISNLVSFSQFMERYVNLSKTRTKDGFNPLLDDYSNVKFYWSMCAA